MLNTKKVLYILPDLAYVVEFLPGKKPHEFSIQNFKQINGDLLDGNKLLESNLKKLAGKVEAGTYHLVLPDILFTNTIVNVEETSESAVQDYLKEEILPDLKVDQDSHQIETFVLTELKGQSKVQLSTMQRSVLNPLRKALADSEIKVENIYPLSWTLKSMVSLEPSITVAQMGSNLYMAKHYIGVDQPIMNELDNVDRIVEATKTLKGSEPNIQTLYLLANELVEEELKEKLSDVLPIQQLAKEEDEDAKIPSYVSKALQYGMQSIAIEDWQLPEFELGKLTEEAAVDEAETEEEEAELPEPSAIKQKVESKKEEKEEEEPKEPEQEAAAAAGAAGAAGAAAAGASVGVMKEKPLTIEKPETEAESKKAKEEEVPTETESEQKKAADIEEVSDKTEKKKEPAKDEDKAEKSTEPKADSEEEEEVDLAQFIDSSDESDEKEQQARSSKSSTKPKSKMKKEKKQKPNKKVVKNKDGTGKFLKVVLIGLASFAVTVAIGVGIGIGVLRLTSSEQGIKTPISQSQEEAEPTQEPSPTPTPEPEINREDVSIKVVNATTQSGYAGDVSDILDEAGYGQAVAANASGEYEEGFYLLMAEEDQALLDALAEDTGFELTYAEDVDVEDAQGEYDAVLVLAQTSE